ncbi:MAG TPA: hypothetical protein VF516_13540 [Kofleriaceae bacterium]
MLSLVALLVLAGHAVAIVRFRSYWPFDHYPMYSFPISRMRYPIVRGGHLTMFSLVEVNDDGTTTDLLSGADIYPEAFHPLDRIEVVVTLVRAGMLEGLERELPASQHIDDRGAGSMAQLQKALCDLLEFARTNRPSLSTLRLVALEWSDFRNPQSDFKHPDRSRVIAEVSHS